MTCSEKLSGRATTFALFGLSYIHAIEVHPHATDFRCDLIPWLSCYLYACMLLKLQTLHNHYSTMLPLIHLTTTAIIATTSPTIVAIPTM